MIALQDLTAIYDAMRRLRPDAVRELSRQFPHIAGALEGARILGQGNAQVDIVAARALVDVALSVARGDLNEVLEVIKGRTKQFARIRLFTGGVSALASVGILGAIVAQARAAQLSTAGVGLISTFTGLYLAYFEEIAGGSGSTHRLRDLTLSLVRKLSDAEGEAQIGLLENNAGKIMKALIGLNGIVSEIQPTRAQLGMKI